MPKNSLAKARALRISLRSHAQDVLAERRNQIVLLAIGVCGLWFLISLFAGQRGRQRYSPGPISRAHDQLKCESCHNASAPLRDATFLSWLKNSESNPDQLWHRKTDTMCQVCHPVRGQLVVAHGAENKGAPALIGQTIPVSPHSPHQVLASVDSCASCHAEHRGFDVAPSIVSDSSCISCHQNLTGHRIGQGDKIATEVTQFANERHPEFRSLAQDQGTLKFNHVLHMTAGLNGPEGNQQLNKTWSDYPDRSGIMSEYADASGRVLLDCKFCHLPTNEVTSQKGIPANANPGDEFVGRLMSMPNYEQHCKVCHSNDFQPPVGSNFDSALKIEHGASPEKLANDLRVYFSLQVTPNELRQPRRPVEVPKEELPIRLWDGDLPATDLTESFREFFAHAATSLNTSCLHCHLSTNPASQTTLPEVRRIKPFSDESESGNMFNLSWFEHGRFDHASHRDVNCSKCHTLTEGNKSSTNSGTITPDRPMINGLASCLECHQTGTVKTPNRAGPVNCTACHSYHAGGK